MAQLRCYECDGTRHRGIEDVTLAGQIGVM